MADETVVFVVPALAPFSSPGTGAGLPAPLRSQALEFVADFGVGIVIEAGESGKPPCLGLGSARRTWKSVD